MAGEGGREREVKSERVRARERGWEGLRGREEGRKGVRLGAPLHIPLLM